MVLGTHTAENEQNTLMVVKIRLPNEDAEIDARKYDDQQGGAKTIQIFPRLMSLHNFHHRTWRLRWLGRQS